MAAACAWSTVVGFGATSRVLPTAKVLLQRPIHPDVDVNETDGVLATARVAHAEDQRPLPRESRAARGRTET